MSPAPTGVLKRLRRRAWNASPTGLYAIGTRLAGAAVSFAGGALALALLDPERIGIFLSFTSLAGFSAVADLGLSYSFLLAAASRPPEEASPVAAAALKAAIPTVAATGVTLFLGGAVFLGEGGVATARWFLPWMSYCAVSSVQLVLLLALTYIEGTGRRHAAWRANFWIEVAAGLAFLAVIGLRAELWALAAASVVRVGMILFLFAWYFELPKAEATAIDSRFALWRDQLWPMQWKNLVNNLMGLLTTRLLTPLLLATQGAAAAGRIGLILALGIVIVATTSAWPLSQTALYAALYHQGRGKELIALFRRTLLASTALAVLFSAGAGVFCEALRAVSPHMATRLPSSQVLWLVLAAPPFGHMAYCFAIVLRSQRRDPVVIPNLLLSFPALVAYWYAARAGLPIFAGIYLLTTICFTALYAFHQLRFLTGLRDVG